MSTNIVLEEVPFLILEAVKARILAKRQQLGKPRESTRPLPQFRQAGATSTKWRLPQYGVGITEDNYTFGFSAYYFYQAFQSPSAIWRVFSGDTTVWLNIVDTISRPSGSGSQYLGFSTIVLPIDASTSILVGMARGVISYNGSYVTNAVINRAFLVSRQAVRQISIPSNLQAAIDVLNPSTEDPGEFFPDGDNTTGFAPRQIRYVSVGISDAYRIAWTPKVYDILNNIAPFVSQSNILQYPLGDVFVVNDWRYGYPASDPNDWSWYFALWSGDPENIDQERPELLTPLDDGRILLPSNWPTAILDGIQGSIITTLSHDSFYTWDWNDPGYCRSMCKALGFSDADLTP